eukprot:2851448-Amphidinium_carterae.1
MEDLVRTTVASAAVAGLGREACYNLSGLWRLPLEALDPKCPSLCVPLRKGYHSVQAAMAAPKCHASITSSRDRWIGLLVQWRFRVYTSAVHKKHAGNVSSPPRIVCVMTTEGEVGARQSHHDLMLGSSVPPKPQSTALVELSLDIQQPTVLRNPALLTATQDTEKKNHEQTCCPVHTALHC